MAQGAIAAALGVSAFGAGVVSAGADPDNGGQWRNDWKWSFENDWEWKALERPRLGQVVEGQQVAPR